MHRCCNIGQNVGTAGVGVFKRNKCNMLLFKRLAPGLSGNITIIDNIPDCNILIDTDIPNINEPTECSLAVGTNALNSITTGINDTAIGQNALQNNTTGNNNTALGCNALNSNTTGNNNIGLGVNAGNAITTTDDNILIGNTGILGDSGEIRIGTSGVQGCVTLPGSLSLIDEQYETPLTGTTVTVLNTTSIVIIDPAGTLATLTIDMPLSPKDGQIVKINITQDINTLTHSGNGNILVAPFPTNIFANASGTWYFRSANSTWYPIDIPLNIVPALPTGYVSGAELVWVSITDVTIGNTSFTATRDSTDTFNLRFTGTLTADITVAGAGGLQSTLVEASDTWYEIWVIGDSTNVNTTNVLITTSAAGNQAGYDKFRRVGWIFNNSSSNIRNFQQEGKGSFRTYLWDEDTNELQILDSGAGSTTWTTASVADFVPPGGKSILMNFEFDLDADEDILFLRSGRNTSIAEADAAYRFTTGAVTGAGDEFNSQARIMLLGSGPSFQWATSTVGNAIEFTALGWNDEL